MGPINKGKGHKRFILVAIDNCRKWIWTKVSKAGNTKTAIALLNRTVDESGVPYSIKTDNATAFTSSKFQDTVNRLHIIHRLSTPYVHTPIGTVERNIRTLEEYVRTFLIEDNHLKTAVKRATKVIRFTVSKSTGTSPFQKHHGRAPRNVFNNLLDLDNSGRGILKNVYDLDGSYLAQNSYEPDLISRMVFNRTHGRSASSEDLNKELLKRQVSNKFQYFVVKNHSRKGMESRFELTPHKVLSETKHTVSDGVKTYHKKDVANVTNVVINNPQFIQGKIKYDTKYKPQGRDGAGKFRTPDNSTRTDMVPVRGPKKSTAATTATTDNTAAQNPLAAYMPKPATQPQPNKTKGKGKTRKNKTRAPTPESEFICFSDSETESDCLPLAKRRKKITGISNFQPAHTPTTNVPVADPFSRPDTTSPSWPNSGMAFPSPQLPPPILPTIISRNQFSYPDDQMQLVHVPRPPPVPNSSTRAAHGKPSSCFKTVPRRSTRLPKAGPPNRYGSINYK